MQFSDKSVYSYLGPHCSVHCIHEFQLPMAHRLFEKETKLHWPNI